MAKIAAFFYFQAVAFAVCICICEENEGLQREYLFAAGFPIGARSIPVGTRFSVGKSSVLYLCFRLTRERGWRHTLRCGRVWQQTLFRGSRTGGFCDVSYSTNAGFSRSKIRLAGKGSEGIYSPRPAAATLPVSAFLSFSLAVGHGRFPTLADGSFQVLGQL